jgi:ribosome-binding ATPase YchF (GTP1/OBG family)
LLLGVLCLLTIGIIGKTNTGKTTLFNAATLLNAEISNFPFTTKTPNTGTAFVCDTCVCKELGVKDNPLNSACIDGWRYAQVEIIDVPGLIKDAWKGRGLGNQFLSVVGSADALIHVVDASGSIDAEGEITQPGNGNPVQDAIDIEMELTHWLAGIVVSNEQRIIREGPRSSTAVAIAEPLVGLKATVPKVSLALVSSGLDKTPFALWTTSQVLRFSSFLLQIIKPMLIVANKMDVLTSEKFYDLLVKHYGHSLVAACSAEAELVLRRAEKLGLLQYVPGGEKFKIVEGAELTSEQRGALKHVQTRVMDKFMRTGIQQALNTVVFKLLRMNMVYAVSDETEFTDHHGNVLPDVFLMPDGSTPVDLAMQVHTSLAENYVFAIDAKTGVRLPADYSLRHRDIVKILATKKAKKAPIFRKLFRRSR